MKINLSFLLSERREEERRERGHRRRSERKRKDVRVRREEWRMRMRMRMRIRIRIRMKHCRKYICIYLFHWYSSSSVVFVISFFFHDEINSKQ